MKKYQPFLVIVFSLLILFSGNSYSQYYYNKAASFSGTNSYIAIPDNAELNPTTNITIEAWVYPKVNTGCNCIVGKKWPNSYWFGLNCGGGALRFYPDGGHQFNGNATIPLNKWTHVAATYDGSTTKLYVNGVLDASTNSGSFPLKNTTDSLCIGADARNSYLWNGYIDNVRIWNVARTATQIQNSMYITLQMNKPTGNYAGLVAAYNLDWDASDLSGATSNNGNFRNVTLVDLNGKPVNYVDYNNALVLDGNSYCAVENHTEFNATTAITLEAWIKRDLSTPQNNYQNVVNKSGGASRYNYALYIDKNGALALEVNSGALINSLANVITQDRWYHVAATYNSVDGKTQLYVDGALVKEITITGKPLIANDADSLYISGIGATSVAANKFKGQIDEVRIWKDVVRTQAQIKAEMYATRGNGSIVQGGFTYAFNESTNWAITSNNGTLTLPLNFRGNAYLSSSHLQNDYTSPLLTTTMVDILSGFNISTNRTTIQAGGTATDSVNITTTGNVNGVQAFVALNHGAVGKLSMSLISPTGVTVNLLPAQNASLTDHDIMTIFDPAADSTISFTNGLKAPFSPRVKPFGSFTSFNGSIATGKWKLRITDATTGTMLRLLNGWGLKLGITVGVNDNELPTNFELNQNYPNPFNPTTTISYSLPKTAFVTLKIFDTLGREVTTLVSENKLPGKYEVQFDGTKLSSGVYFYKITAGNYIETKKLILIK